MKIFKSLSAALLIAGAVGIHANAEGIKVFVDNVEVSFTDQAPEIVDGSTMVPIRAVFEKAGATVSWDAETKTATIKGNDNVVDVTLDTAYIVKNGAPVALSVPATLINERLAIPVRAISEAMDYGVTWNSIRQSVLISTKGKNYRANAQWKTGFLPMNEAGFMLSSAVYDIPYFDLNLDSTDDPIAFIPGSVAEDGSDTPGSLWIAGENYSSVLESGLVPYAFAVVDVIASDSYKEIAVLYNSEEGRFAGFYRFNGSDVFKMSVNSTPNGLLPFTNTLFFDGCENIVSDLDGLCFLNDMICTGVYSLEGSDIMRYSWNVEGAVAKTFTNTNLNNILLCYQEVTTYKPGQYVDSDKESMVIDSNELYKIKVLGTYVDSMDPSKFEFYVELSDGKKAVIWSYTA